MKTTMKLKGIAMLGIAIMLTACSSDDNSKQALRNFKQSKCKELMTFAKGTDLEEALGHETIRLQATADGGMKITHTNVRFTCEATINVAASIDGSTINITETAPPETNCICPYDIEAEVGTLTTKDYSIVVKANDATLLTKSFTYSPTLDTTFDVLRK